MEIIEKAFFENQRKLVIRKAAIEDSDKMAEYMSVIGGESNYLTFGEGEIKVTTEIQGKIIESINCKDNSIMLIALLKDEIVGSIVFRAGEKDRVKHVGELGLTVRKAYWNCGIGGSLLEILIKWAKDTKIIRKINLRVRTDNENAIKLYEKHGFMREGVVTRDFYINEKFYDSIQMGLKVD